MLFETKGIFLVLDSKYHLDSGATKRDFGVHAVIETDEKQVPKFASVAPATDMTGVSTVIFLFT